MAWIQINPWYVFICSGTERLTDDRNQPNRPSSKRAKNSVHILIIRIYWYFIEIDLCSFLLYPFRIWNRAGTPTNPNNRQNIASYIGVSLRLFYSYFVLQKSQCRLCVFSEQIRKPSLQLIHSAFFFIQQILSSRPKDNQMI